MNTSCFKDIAVIIEATVTVIALIVGGIWSYWLFVRNRQKWPRASIAHQATHRHIGNDKLLLHVTVTVSNVGEVLLSVVSLETRICQVLPLRGEILHAIESGQNPVPQGETEAPWPLIDSQECKYQRGDCEVEPGETQDIHHDFILDAEIETIEVYTYLINERKRPRDIAWDLTSLYQLHQTEDPSFLARKGSDP